MSENFESWICCRPHSTRLKKHLPSGIQQKTAPVSLKVILFWIRNNGKLQKPGDLLCNIPFSRFRIYHLRSVGRLYDARWNLSTLLLTLILKFLWFYSVINHLLQQTLQIKDKQCFVRQIIAFYAPPYASGQTLPDRDSHQHYHSVLITQFARKTDYLKTGHDHYHSEALCVSSLETNPHRSTTWWTDSNATNVSILRPQKTVSCFVCYKIIWERKISMVTLQSQQTHARMTTNNVISLEHQPQTTRLCGECNHSDWRHQRHRRSGHGEYLTITLICILVRSILTWWIFRGRPKIRPAHHLEQTRCTKRNIINVNQKLERACGLHCLEYSTSVRLFWTYIQRWIYLPTTDFTRIYTAPPNGSSQTASYTLKHVPHCDIRTTATLSRHSVNNDRTVVTTREFYLL
jgi:hypothetical protein